MCLPFPRPDNTTHLYSDFLTFFRFLLYLLLWHGRQCVVVVVKSSGPEVRPVFQFSVCY